MHAGTLFLTLYHNFNMSLKDKHLPLSLKVHIQLEGPKQVAGSVEATLHYQLAYRIQNHALDLKLPPCQDALIIKADNLATQTPICVCALRQLSHKDLIALLPEK